MNGSVEDDGAHLTFRPDGQPAGRYRYDDPMKPHLHPLLTPSGRVVTLASPHDHPHHKGVMFAFRTRTLNFWEERGGNDGVPGRQQHLAFEDAHDLEDDEVGVVEHLAWREAPDGPIVADEQRTLACRFDAARRCFVWRWRSKVHALADLECVMSPASATDSLGRRVNYHGLGMRFVRDFGATGGTAIRLDGVRTTFAAAMGAQPGSVTFEGTFDPDPATPDMLTTASVTLRYDGRGAVFAMEAPFAYLAWGPSNLAPLTVLQGEGLDERYVIEVADGGS